MDEALMRKALIPFISLLVIATCAFQQGILAPIMTKAPVSAASTISQVSGHNCNGSSGGGNASTSNCAITTQSTGNMNVAVVFFCANSSCNATGSGVTITVNDSTNAGNYTLCGRKDGSTSFVTGAVYYYSGIGSTASNTVTVTTGSTVSYIRLYVSEWHSQGGSPCDSATFGSLDTTAASSPGAVVMAGSTAATNEAAFTALDTNVALTVPSTYTALNTSDAGSGQTAFKIQASTGTFTGSWTWTGTANNALGLIVGLK